MTAALAACFAFGCASRPEGALTPTAAAPPDAARVELLAATTRAPSEAPGALFGGDRADATSYRDIAVSIPPNREVGSVQWPTPGAADPAREFALVSQTAVQPSDLSRTLARLTPNDGRVLVYVHGFNTRFDAAVFNFAQLVHDMGAPVAPVLFSWPSSGRLLGYVHDRESANFSRSDLAGLLRTIADNPRVRDVVVLAHSMGAWLATESLRQLALEDGRVAAKISNLILASPDLDVDVFRKQLREMGPDRPRVTIFVSQHDRALRLSALIAGGIDRVGAVDLSRPENVASLEQAPGVVVLDLSALQSDFLAHSKFATSPEAVRLLGDRLIAGQGLDGSEAGVVNAADAFGGALGGVAAAPILLFTGQGGR